MVKGIEFYKTTLEWHTFRGSLSVGTEQTFSNLGTPAYSGIQGIIPTDAMRLG